ncbi:MAG: pilus assembly protein [Bdellovibrionales bacterium GWB1_55_8]|nr:MAG: pilus assembly protein [Bdellovibrionales bacterium GWB1_55_8]
MGEVYKDSVGVFLSPIREYLEDDSVSEVLINGANEVFVERRGILERTNAKFHDEQALQAAVRNIAQFVGRRIDEENPTLDARLPDGSRVAAVIPPCSRKGTTLSIRKFSKGAPTFADLINRGSISKDAARFLDVCIFLGKNTIVSGGTGSGKTTLLNVLGSRIPKTQRLLIIEDSSELKIVTDHVVFFETKAANAEGKGEVTIRDLVRSALRLRPDRIIVGEVRGPESLDLITAMNTGHGGSMGTTHANTPYDALVRLETLAMMGDTQVPVMAIRRQISAAVHIVVQIKRMADGTRKVTHVSEIIPEVDDQGRYQFQDIFKFVQRGRGPQGQIIGEMVATGRLPTFMDEIETNRLPFGRDKFAAPDWYVQMIAANKNAA